MPPTSSAAPRTVSSSGGSRTVKVLHVITGLGVGGAELQLKAFLQHTRHECDVVTLYNPGPVAEMIRGGGNLVRDLCMTRNMQLSALLTLHRLVRASGLLLRLDPNKQFDLVIEAAAPLLNGRTKLLVVGKGEEQAHLSQVAADCGVTEQVIFAGERHDVAAMLSAMDLFVASSAQETFGLSVLEALGNGAPVLYTTCPALEGLDVSRAWHVPATVLGLHEAVAAEVRTGPRDRVPEPVVEKTYGIQAVTNRIDDLYEQLAARRTWRTLRGRTRRQRRARLPTRSAQDGTTTPPPRSLTPPAC